MTTNIIDKLKEQLYVEHKRSAEIFPQLLPYKQKAWNIFLHRGIPTTKHENWKYFSLKNDFESITKINAIINVPQNIDLLQEYNNVVLINGEFQSQLSNVEDNIIVRKFSEMEDVNFVGDIKDIELDSIAALNTAIFREGTYMKITATPNKPIKIIHILNNDNFNLLLTPRVFIEIGSNVNVNIHEEFKSSSTDIIYNIVCEAVVGDSTKLTWERIYDFPENITLIHYTAIAQQKNSYTKSVIVAKNHGRLRNDYEVSLKNIHSKAELYGLSLGEKNALIDHKTKVNHMEPECESFQLYKGIAKDKSTIVFNGNINVFPEAQKTNAFQESHHLLRSYDANVFARPQLEILADDVKCSHGATLGKLDQSAIFYMRTRGINKNLAEQMLLDAFANEILQHLTMNTST